MHYSTEAPRPSEEEKILQEISNQAMAAAGAKWWPWIKRDTASLLLRCWRHNNICGALLSSIAS
ncbi:hypothetical protein SynBMKMC1_01261 [Synechococcus sp. BMK-MC-1]|nr:hypothetical protein SynBMKMC1_01261 [Synechococcus sp. BMK-MC-1]